MTEIEELKKRKDLRQLRDKIERFKLCVFCTKLVNIPFSARPMTILHVDDDCGVWLISRVDGRKIQEIKQDNRVELIFTDLATSEFLTVNGVAKIITNKKKVIELWRSELITWFENGPEDKDITLIKISPHLLRFWDKTQSKEIEVAADKESDQVPLPAKAEVSQAVGLKLLK